MKPPAEPAAAPSRRIGPPLVRWLHLYLSMAGLAATLFFSVTGLTLNHPDWLFGTSRREDAIEGQLDAAWVKSGAPADQVAKLEIVEALRAAHGVKSALDDFRIDPNELSIAFKGPGYAADFFVDRRTGHYEGTVAYEGLVAVFNDLHKGRHTGAVWSVVIDVSAVVLAIVSLTGLLLLWYTKRRRWSGLVTGLIGLALCALVAIWWAA